MGVSPAGHRGHTRPGRLGATTGVPHECLDLHQPNDSVLLMDATVTVAQGIEVRHLRRICPRKIRYCTASERLQVIPDRLPMTSLPWPANASRMLGISQDVGMAE